MCVQAMSEADAIAYANSVIERRREVIPEVDLLKLYAAMEDNMTSAEVQEKACGALGHAAYYNAANRIPIVSSGGLIAIFNAMDNHVGSSRVQVCPRARKYF